MYQYHKDRPTPHLLHDIVKGNMWDTRPVNIFGFNKTVGIAFETLWDDGGNYVYPSSAVQMDATSSSASDTMDVKISGLDANYDEISETVTLTGTGTVTTTASFLRINSAIILSGSNVGDITISNGGTTYAFIGATLGTTQSSVYTVPAGHSLYLFRIDVCSGTNNGQKYLTFRNVAKTHTGRTLRVAEATFSTSQVSFDRQVPFKIGEKTDFHFEAKSSASENEVSIFIEAILVKDD
jgi:hypothetical protein